MTTTTTTTNALGYFQPHHLDIATNNDTDQFPLQVRWQRDLSSLPNTTITRITFNGPTPANNPVSYIATLLKRNRKQQARLLKRSARAAARALATPTTTPQQQAVRDAIFEAIAVADRAAAFCLFVADDDVFMP